jgi:cytochrome b subunit of formate dehydrogenase
VGAIVAGLFVHVYMAAVLPEERPAFFSMFSGKVNELYAFLHHRKWWREMKRKEAEFIEELDALDEEESSGSERDSDGSES